MFRKNLKLLDDYKNKILFHTKTILKKQLRLLIIQSCVAVIRNKKEITGIFIDDIKRTLQRKYGY